MPETRDLPSTALRPLTGTYLDGLATGDPPGGGLVPGPIELVRAWPQGHGRLALEYRDADGDLLGAQLFADEAEHDDAARRTPGSVTGHADDGRQILLQPRGADRRVPGLAPLLDDPGALLVVHRPERRGVVRIARPGGEVFAKAVRPKRIGALVCASVGAAALVEGTALSVPQPTMIDRTAGVVHFRALAGDPLHARLGDPAAAALAGTALRMLHDRAPSADLPVHGARAEAAVVRGWVDRLAGSLPSLDRDSPAGECALRATALVEGIVEMVEGGSPGVVVPVHRDLHDKQILLDGDRVALLDCDTVARGEAALDLANLLAHLELRGMQGRCTAVEARAAADAALVAYAPARGVARRLSAYAAATYLRLACVYALRPTRPRLVSDLLDLAARAGQPLGAARWAGFSVPEPDDPPQRPRTPALYAQARTVGSVL